MHGTPLRNPTIPALAIFEVPGGAPALTKPPKLQDKDDDDHDSDNVEDVHTLTHRSPRSTWLCGFRAHEDIRRESSSGFGVGLAALWTPRPPLFAQRFRLLGGRFGLTGGFLCVAAHDLLDAYRKRTPGLGHSRVPG